MFKIIILISILTMSVLKAEEKKSFENEVILPQITYSQKFKQPIYNKEYDESELEKFKDEIKEHDRNLNSEN